MNKLIRFYNQNRHIIWLVILSVTAIIALIQILDDFAYEKNNANKNSNINTYKNDTPINNNFSVVTEEEIKSSVTKIIDKFIHYCNNGKVEEAYELLSYECKKVLYPSLEDFTKKYYNRIFTEKKMYVCQAWISEEDLYTYRINFTEDMLATGGSNKTSILDYYTVVEDNGKYKLNINKFIDFEDVNSQIKNSNVIINVKSKKIYMDYETYDIELINKTQKTIMLDDMQSTKNIYVEDNNKAKYFWYNHEISEKEVEIRSGFNQNISIKFDKAYKAYRETVKIVFSNIILDDNKSISIIVEI